MNKQKLKWRFVTNPFDVYVLDPFRAVKRVHTPLIHSLSIAEDDKAFLHLRSCVQGTDENGCVVKYLYCTRDGRFFVRLMDGWYEVLPSNAKKPRISRKCGGAFDSPSMSHFGHKYCHRCVAYAWCNPPQDVSGLEVDHLNGDHKNWSADNLEWVTPNENRRRAKLLRELRKAGFDPSSCTTAALRIILSI